MESNAAITSLVADIREQLRYLQELGVDDVDVEFAAVSEMRIMTAPRDLSVSESKSMPERVAGSELDKIVSGIRSSTDTKQTEVRSNVPRRDLLGSSRIAGRSYKGKINLSQTQKQPTTPDAASAEASSTIETLADIHSDIGADCKRCALCEGRNKIVHSVGSETARLMVVGEAPGADEDLKGEPFVGRAGQLLTKILEGIDFAREDVFIGNINRCRPPDNRKPTLEETAQCKPFLKREIAVVKPEVIVVMGNTATQNLLDTSIGISKLRGTFAEYMGVKVMPTFHPAYLLRDPRKKREVWEDMKKVRAFLDR